MRDARCAIVRTNWAKDTKPEVTLRRMLHAMGYRFNRLAQHNGDREPEREVPAGSVELCIQKFQRGFYFRRSWCRADWSRRC